MEGAMSYKLWRGEELLGESDLETPTADDGRAGFFRPTPAFTAVWPVFQRLQELARESMAAVEGRRQDLPPGEATRQVLAERGLGAAIVESFDQLRALGLVVRDAEGAPMPAGGLIVSEMQIPTWPDMPEKLRAEVEADFQAAGMKYGGPNYVLVLLPERFGQALPKNAAPA